MKYKIGQLVLSFIRDFDDNDEIINVYPIFGCIIDVYSLGQTYLIEWDDSYRDYYDQKDTELFVTQAVECKELEDDFTR